MTVQKYKKMSTDSLTKKSNYFFSHFELFFNHLPHRLGKVSRTLYNEHHHRGNTFYHGLCFFRKSSLTSLENEIGPMAPPSYLKKQ